MSLLRNLNLQNINLDRRQKLRIVPNELVFLQLERDDGGTVLDVSEGRLVFETFAPVTGSASADMTAAIVEDPAVQAQPSVLVPVQKYVAAKRRQLIFGLILGICISSMFAMAALKFSNYLRQSRGPEKVSEEWRAARTEPEIKQPTAGPSAVTPPAAPAATNASSADIFSGSNPKKASSSGHVLNPQLATATLPARSRRMEPAKPAAASALPAVQQHSSEIASKGQPSRTPEQLWASVQAGNSKAALELAELYIKGNSVPQNCTQARVLLMVASEKRNAGAIKRLQELDKAGCPGE